MEASEPISMATRVVRRADVFFEHIDDEIVMMTPALDSYCGINAIGSRIWQMIESPVTLSDLCATLVNEYEVESDVCEREVKAFVETLLSEDLARTVPDHHEPGT